MALSSQAPSTCLDILRILFVTDNHLGFKERDNVRATDTFDALEEILLLGTSLNVDFILHGGDLFDYHKPSRSTIILNQESRSKVFKLKKAHFENPNSFVTIPILGIHGNHDDPSEEAFLSCLDILEAADLATYFGWTENLDVVDINPILLQKGATKVALYGLGNIRDERLHRAFLSNKVSFTDPEIGNRDDYFNVMVLHQNRFKGQFGGVPNKNCIHEQMLPKFLDLVLWGHEHDCIQGPTESLQAEFHIIQPGSSVATSLAVGEALPKHVVLIEILGDSFRSTFIPLRTIRPLQISEVVLADEHLTTHSDDVLLDFLKKKIEELINSADKQWKRHIQIWESELITKILPTLSLTPAALEPLFNWIKYQYVLGQSDLTKAPLPCISLKVEYTGYEPIHVQRLGCQFIGSVANPTDLVSFFKRRKMDETVIGMKNKKEAANVNVYDPNNLKETVGQEVHELVFRYLEDTTMELLPEIELNNAIQTYVQKSDAGAIDRYVQSCLSHTTETVKSVAASTPEELKKVMNQVIENFRQNLVKQQEETNTFVKLRNEEDQLINSLDICMPGNINGNKQPDKSDDSDDSDSTTKKDFFVKKASNVNKKRTLSTSCLVDADNNNNNKRPRQVTKSIVSSKVRKNNLFENNENDKQNQFQDFTSVIHNTLSSSQTSLYSQQPPQNVKSKAKAQPTNRSVTTVSKAKSKPMATSTISSILTQRKFLPKTQQPETTESQTTLFVNNKNTTSKSVLPKPISTSIKNVKNINQLSDPVSNRTPPPSRISAESLLDVEDWDDDDETTETQPLSTSNLTNQTLSKNVSCKNPYNSNNTNLATNSAFASQEHVKKLDCFSSFISASRDRNEASQKKNRSSQALPDLDEGVDELLDSLELYCYHHK